MSDTQLNELVINELTKAQYEALTPESNQLYLVTDEIPLDSSVIVTSVSSASTDDKVPSAKAVYNYHDSTKVDANNAITTGTATKITYDSKGLVTAGTNLEASDIPNLTLSKVSDVTATASELNVLDGITATTAELNYTDGVTSNIQTQLNNKAGINSTTNYVPYKSGTSTFSDSTLMYNSNAMAFTGKLHIGSSSPASYSSKGRLTVYDNTPYTQTSSLALLNYGGGGGCGVSIDMYNTSSNGGIPSGKIGVIDNGNYSAYLEIGCKKSGAESNPVIPICTMTPLPYSGAGYTTFNVGRSYYDNSIFDIYTSGTWEYVNDNEQRWTGSGTTYTVGTLLLKPKETYAVGDMISLSSDGANAVTITDITYNSSNITVTTSATLGSLSSRYVYIKKGLMRVHSSSNTYFFVNPLGKTGIGTMNPQYELDTVGTINASTAIKVNGTDVATVDDSSTTSTTATWSASKLNTTIGNIETAINAIRGVS